MALMAALIDLGMNGVVHPHRTFHLFTIIRLVHGQYLTVKDEFRGIDGGHIEIRYDQRTPGFWAREWNYTLPTKNVVKAQIVQTMQDLGGGAARIQAGPWLTRMIGNRYGRTRLFPAALRQLQQAVHPVPVAVQPVPFYQPLPVQHQVPTLNSYPYGNAELVNAYNSTDPITYEDIPLDQALYLSTNLPDNGKIRQLWAYEQSLKRMLELGGPLVSPTTRRPFQRANIKRLRVREENVPLAQRRRHT